MIQKAIIEDIVDNYTVKVRIPKYDKMYVDGLKFDELSTGIICTVPGTKVNYSVNDVVLVGFENDEIGKPVILGLLYTDKESNSTVDITQVSKALNNIDSVLDNITNKNYYTHIKYSNDAGVTFTSLYDYSDVIADNGTFYCKDILIDKKSSFIKWDILDDNNQNCTDKFELKLIIHNDNEYFESNNVITDIPNIYNYADKLTIDYYITPIGVNIEDYNIALYTDKNPLGTTEGDYVGIYNSTSYIPSLNPIDYSWISIKERMQKFIDTLNNNINERIKVIEKYLYGKSSDEVIDDLKGINSALEVSTNTLNMSKKDNIKISKNIYVDTTNNSVLFNNILIIANKNGHLTIK